ncbi:MAG: GTPase, partial [bacterium]
SIEKTIILQLKVLADVGLVGFPNAGKSTLLSVISAAKPEIADYPFTTLVPNLGIVAYRDNKSFVMADIPGIIEGAAEGRGLGLRFLRHIERNSILLFMIPADSDDIIKEFDILLNELKQYNPELVDKQRILAITKCDMLDSELMEEIKKLIPKDIQTVFISSLSGLGLTELKDLIWTEINKESNKVVELKHRPMEITYHDVEEEDEELEDDEEEDEDDDLSKYKGIGWDEL